MMVNSFILYKETKKLKNLSYISMYEYRKTIIRWLIYPTRRYLNIPTTSEKKTMNYEENHFRGSTNLSI